MSIIKLIISGIFITVTFDNYITYLLILQAYSFEDGLVYDVWRRVGIPVTIIQTWGLLWSSLFQSCLNYHACYLGHVTHVTPLNQNGNGTKEFPLNSFQTCHKTEIVVDWLKYLSHTHKQHTHGFGGGFGRSDRQSVYCIIIILKLLENSWQIQKQERALQMASHLPVNSIIVYYITTISYVQYV